MTCSLLGGIIIFLLVIFNLALAVPPTFSSVSYEIVASSVLGVELSLGVFQVEFDQPLYFNDVEYCLPGCLTEPTCEPCNFALQGDQCGSTQNPTSSEMKQKTTASDSETIRDGGGCNCYEQIPQFCRDSNTWITLQDGVALSNQIITAVPTFYRFHTTQRCSGIHFQFSTLPGTVEGSINWGKGPLTPSEKGDMPILQGSPFLVCPRNPSYQLGTVFLSLWSAVTSNLTLSVSLFDTQNFKEPPLDEEPECADNPGQDCPKPGTMFQKTVPAILPTAFRLTVTECRLYFIHLEVISTQGGIPQQIHIFGPSFQPVGIPNYFVDSVRPLLLTICPKDESGPSTVYVVMLVDSLSEWLIIASPYDEKWFPSYRKTGLDELMNTYRFRAFDGLLQLTCPTFQFYCGMGCTSFRECCSHSWTILPIPSPTPLYPLPPALQSFDSALFGDVVEWKEQKSESSQKAVLVVAFEMIMGNTKSIPVEDWREILETDCRIETLPWSTISNWNASIVRGSVSLVGRERFEKCDYENFQAVSDHIAELIEHLDPTSTLQRFQIDEETFGQAWQGCSSFVLSLMSQTSSVSTISNSTNCPSDMIGGESDPCCDSDLNWEHCCIPREIRVNETVVTPSAKNIQSAECSSQCLYTLTTDYAFYSNLLTSSRGCTSAVQSDPQILRRDGLVFYHNCKTKYFGEDGKGKRCVSNEECPSQHCDITKMVCVFDDHQQYLDVVQQFFECVVEEMPSSTSSFILKKYQDNLNQTQGQGESERLLKILGEYFMTNSCVADYGPSSTGTHVEYVTSTGACPPCPSICLDEWCPIPLQCEFLRLYGRPSSVCGSNFLSIQNQTQAGCENELVCGWNSGLPTESCLDNVQHTKTRVEEPFVCVVCETPINCIPVMEVKSAQECSSTTFCLSGNRSVVSGLSEEQCVELVGSCSLPCPNCSKEQCEEIGRCSDQDLITYLNSAGPIIHLSIDQEAYCWKEIKPWNDPDCGVDSTSSTWMPFSLGCLLVVNETGCDQDSGHWREVYKTQTQCETQMSCIEPKVYTTLRTPKNSSQCELCGGQSVPLFDWEPGQWIEGKPMKGKWVSMNESRSKDYWASSVNFMELANVIEQSTQTTYYLELETQLYCRLNPTRVLLEQISCICDVHSHNQTACFDQSSIDIGSGTACPNVRTQLTVPPSILTFYEDSVIGECVEFSVISLIADTLSNHNQQTISTSFRKLSSNTDPVKNSKGGYIGQILGNGVQLVQHQTQIKSLPERNPHQHRKSQVRGQMEMVQYYELCVDIPGLENVWNNRTYPHLDFGKRDEDYIVPLGLFVRVENEITLCTFINSSNVQQDIFPIAKEASWEEEGSGPSQGELITFIIMCLLYFFVFLFGVFCEVYRGFETFVPIRMVAVFLVALCFVRTIYFLLLAVDVFGKGNTPTIEFIFVEVPTFLYLNGLMVDLVLWTEVGFERFWRKKSVVYRAVLVCMIISVFVLVSVIVAWSLLSENGTYQCAGRVYEEPSTVNQDIVTYVYRGFISVIAICIAIFIFLGSQHAIRVLDQTMKRSAHPGVKASFLQSVQRIGIVASTSLIGQCVFFVAYTAGGHTAFGYAFILLPVELLPVLFLLMIISFTAAKKQKSSGSTRKPTGTSGSGTGVGDQSSRGIMSELR